MKKTVGILGGGAWGTAVATLLAHNNYTVHLWCYEPSVVKDIARSRENKQYLPDIGLSDLIKPTSSLSDIFENAQIIFEALPIVHMRHIFNQAKKHIKHEHSFVVLSKGIEQDSLLVPTQIIRDIVGSNAMIAAVAGPSFAREIALKQITAITIASDPQGFSTDIQAMLKNEYCCPCTSSDLIGVQCGGAFKNVLSLGLGILDGAGCADNTKAFIFTRGIYEMSLLAKSLGGNQATLYGLSGVGDLILTARGKLSRNTYVGRCLGKGKKLEKIIAKLGTVPEGVNTVKSVRILAKKFSLELPVFEGIGNMVHNRWSIEQFLDTVITKSCQCDIV
jgi:glycerol-3-phosphate dehydrogenase (NAD(P)+)